MTANTTRRPGKPLLPCAIVLAALATLVLGGCGSLYSEAPSTKTIKHGLGEHLQAGVASVDITPPTGLALFGHGPDGRVAIGTLLRLKCQAFVFTQGHQAVALVPCDLAAPSLQLHRAVARKVAATGIPLGVNRILLMATHTHAAPAHYFGAQNYAGAFGSRRAGYDPKVEEWLAERISTAVVQAFSRRVPACAAWDVSQHHDLSKNRSFPAFASNRDLDETIREQLDDAAEQDACALCERHTECGVCGPKDPGPEGSTPSGPRSPAEYATDPSLSVLRIDDCTDPAAPRAMGIFAVYGVHPTAIPNTNDLYHGDVFGYATRAVQALVQEGCPRESHPLERPGQCPVVGIANGIQGDVSPAVGFQAPREARRLGRRLAERIKQAHDLLGKDKIKPGPFPIRVAYRELWLPNAMAQDNVPAKEGEQERFWRDLCTRKPALCLPEPKAQGDLHLCSFPAIGTATAGGAEDGPTTLRALPEMQEGVAAPYPETNGCHSHKLVLRTPFVAPTRWEEDPPEKGDDLCDMPLEFPAVVPISQVQLGNKVIATAPAEMTTMVGMRLRNRLEDYLEHLGKPQLEVVVVGLTNAYIQYIATKREYAEQHYEGASTLYGPHSERFLGNHHLCLANSLVHDGFANDEACRLGQTYEVHETRKLEFDPPTGPRLAERPDDIPEIFIRRDLRAKQVNVDGLDTYEVYWQDVPPEWVQSHRDLRVRVVRLTDGSTFDHSDNASMEIKFLDGQWRLRWSPGDLEIKSGCGFHYRFEITTVVTHQSLPFEFPCPDQPMGATEREAAP